MTISDIDIKEFRIKHGISQEKLADMVGVHLRTIQNWESGTKIPHSKYTILRKIIEDKKNNTATNSDTLSDFVIKNLSETVLSQQRVIELLTNRIEKMLKKNH